MVNAQKEYSYNGCRVRKWTSAKWECSWTDLVGEWNDSGSWSNPGEEDDKDLSDCDGWGKDIGEVGANYYYTDI